MLGNKPNSREKIMSADKELHKQTSEKETRMVAIGGLVDFRERVTLLINELCTDTNVKNMNAIVEKLMSLQNHLKEAISYLRSPETKIPTQIISEEQKKDNTKILHPSENFLVRLRCSQFEDFVRKAYQSSKLSFKYEEEQKVIELCAINLNQYITYGGNFPKVNSILKPWLAQILNIPQEAITEGVLSP